mmetsp:Transcript_21542/g.27181  ORF Transcript_21542/g.27181 Transcript_21542/m.27181 type:complete len:205 (+) Transcript_21542:837-1451(+)
MTLLYLAQTLLCSSMDLITIVVSPSSFSTICSASYTKVKPFLIFFFLKACGCTKVCCIEDDDVEDVPSCFVPLPSNVMESPIPAPPPTPKPAPPAILLPPPEDDGSKVLFVPTDDADANVLSMAFGCGMSTAAVFGGGIDDDGGSGGAIPIGGGGSPGGRGGPPMEGGGGKLTGNGGGGGGGGGCTLKISIGSLVKQSSFKSYS